MNKITRPQLPQPGQQIAPPKPIDQVRKALSKMEPEFATALPAHIPVERFKRVVLTAANQNHDLLLADRRTLMGACMKAAQDGLMPDGREGALVIFNTKHVENGQERWAKAVQWMPMVYGIIKKMRNSGELASIVAHEVYEKDTFAYRLGDDESIHHEPFTGDGEPGKMKAVYAIAKLKDGTIQREVMTRAQVEKVRNVSRSKDKGPWVTWYEEMARKTVVRRLSKYLPMSTEIEEMLRRDDAMSVNGRAPDESTAVLTIDGDSDEADAEFIEAEPDDQPTAPKRGRPPKSAAAAEPPHDPETGEIEREAARVEQRIEREQHDTRPEPPAPEFDGELF